MKRGSLAVGSLCLLTALFLGRTSPAQTTARRPSALPPAKTKVYLAGFTASHEPGPGYPDLRFVDTLVRLRFGQIDSIVVTSESPDPSCGQEQSSLRQRIQQMPAPRPYQSPTFYTVRGSLEFDASTNPASQSRGSEESLILNYELLKTVKCVPEPLMRRSEPVPQARTLDALTVMADALALRVTEDAHKRVRIDVKLVSPERAEGDEKDFGKALIDSLLVALARTDDLQPNDLRAGVPETPGDYTLGAEVKVAGSFLSHLGKDKDIEVSLSLTPGEQEPGEAGGDRNGAQPYRLTTDPIRGKMNRRDQLLASVADAALKGISDVREAREMGLSSRESAMSPTERVERAKKLLCDGSKDASCTPRPETAIVLLQQATQQASGNLEAREWLGRAQYLSGRYTDAAQSFDVALKAASAAPPVKLVELSVEEGDAWYKARNFTKAVSSYDEAAARIRSGPAGLHAEEDFNLQRALSHRFAGDLRGSIDALLSPVGTVTDSNALGQELEHVVDNLSASGLPDAIRQLEQSKNPRVSEPALARAYQNQANRLIAAQDYSTAEATARKGLLLKDAKYSPSLSYLLALAHFLEAQSSSESPEQKKRAYRDSSDWLTDALKSDPAMFSYFPLELQMSICSDYLDDQECVQRTMDLVKTDWAALPPELQMDFTEINVLRGKNDSARAILESVLKRRGLEVRLQAIGQFYAVWLDFAEGKASEAERSFEDWKDALERMRKAGTGANWTFGGACRVLNCTSPGSTPPHASLLVEMIHAMENDKAAIASFRL